MGHQSIGQSYGSSIVQCQEIVHGKVDKIIHKGHKLFDGLSNIFEATRYHSLIIKRSTLSSELEVIAETENNIIMGIKHKHKKIYGLQFHPESIGTKNGKLIFKNYLDLISYEY